MIWVTSDHHFNHRAVLDFCNRPWRDVRAMRKGLIRAHNELVEPGDTVYILGDFSFGSRKHNEEILAQMNGLKYLVRGNHDDQRVTKAVGWAAVFKSVTVRRQGVTVHMSHHPPTSPDLSPDRLYLHGHLHRDTIGALPILDVGVDANDMRPVGLDLLIDMALDRKAGLNKLRAMGA